MNQPTRPRDISIDRPNERLTIAWMDGHVSSYPLSGIRAACPCVVCKGGHENMGGPPDRADIHRLPLATWEVTGAQMVGNYALQITWADGHNEGIYRWSTLRALCPCDECEAAADA